LGGPATGKLRRVSRGSLPHTKQKEVNAMTPFSIHATYSSLHVVEFKQIDAVNWTYDVQY
jgi:hypothetical protein